MDQLSTVLHKYRDKPGALLAMLEELQETSPGHYLEEQKLRDLSQATGIPLSQIYSVATFYSYFNLTPQGKHSLVVCRGTACHTRGSLGLLQEALRHIGMELQGGEEEGSYTSADGALTIRTVACFGQCALAPVIALDGKIHSRLTVGRLISIIERLRRG
ncbi:NAD(P)H-dependent oxidoreductase subunit E [Treponema sp. J25]|uniref:NADH-quinone oxidoreductase subunit NuoE family protein n=1 Tax=Treponema sp. J25 TaxID=2094121 RepID=UPI001043A73D|nr:NAD(P)H-dependent oxidoreductase subunit E [Treponema sp. J25]TCW62028.1 NAD(P)H-dependent oxidoreductase subunit E [Treponema sp. J25]